VEDGEGSITGAPQRAAGDAGDEPGAALMEPSDAAHPWFRVASVDAADEALDPCRFLVALDADGRRSAPLAWADGANVCVALGDPAPQSVRQQELVCLASTHRNCPRYLRGVLIEQTPPPRPVRQPVSSAVVVSALVLVASLAASFGFLAVRGSLSVALAGPSAGSSQVAAIPTASLEIVASPSPTETAPPTISPGPSGSPTPSPTPSPTVAPTPKPTATPTPRPSSNRYAVLTACPSTPNCWIYVVRSGDNLVSIAHWFGVPLQAVYDMNPWLRTSGLRAGQQLKIPTPTR
jgi:LysM repeat protein